MAADRKRNVKKALPPGYEVRKQSKDYLYGWNWFHTYHKTAQQGDGYGTQASAIEHAWEHHTRTKVGP